jgi:hypothetical protein
MRSAAIPNASARGSRATCGRLFGAIATSAAVVGLLAVLGVAPAGAVDWAGVPGKEIVLFYPGQSAWEWVLTESSHSGGPKFRDGKNCTECHKGEEKTMGSLLVSGKKNEPTPIAGKPGFIVATIKFAHDADKLYVHLDFAEGAQPDVKMDPATATKVTMMLNDGKVAEATRAGCWGTCHDDLATMPSAAGSERTKYLARSRVKVTRSGGGDQLKPSDEMAKLRADGQYLEYWQARLNPGAPATAIDGTILEKRQENSPASVAAEATSANGTWSVTLSRKMTLGGMHKDIAAGKSYSVGFAIHSGHAARRFHYVSFGYSLVIDQGSADFVAVAK